VVGSIGTSWKIAHPAPLRCVRLNPRICVSGYEYPPPNATAAGTVSGLHCIIPNGTTAPGNVFPAPPPVPKSGARASVPANKFTYDPGSTSAPTAHASSRTPKTTPP
jgi:hypothetical protein